MCLDMGHFDGASGDNFEVIKRFYKKINHVDIKDVVAFDTYKSVPYGSGVTKGEQIVQELIDRGYSGYLVIEQAPPRAGLELVPEMRRIKNIFDQYES
jgi:sugar phosphate isomerase/epimerase